MNGRLSRIIRNISAPEKRRSSTPDLSAQCDKTHGTESTLSPDSPLGSRTGPIVQALHIGGDMNILHKAAHHVPGMEPKKDRKGSRDERAAKEKHHHSIGKSSAKSEPSKPAYLSIEMESPPLVMFGGTSGSTGALMSGQFKLQVDDTEVRLDSLELNLIIEQTNKKPVEKLCPDCATKKTVLRHWSFTSESTTFRHGVHSFPFSYLLEGHLPASTNTHLGSISYHLRGNAHQTPRAGSTSSTSTIGARPSTPVPPEMKVEHILPVLRAIPPPENDRTAIRVFPPTNLQATCTLPPFIHPITNGFPVLLRLSGVSEHADPGRSVRTWRLKKLSWRLEEQSTIVSQACDKHASKVGGQGRGVKHEHVETLGGKELREGWKADYAPPRLDEADKHSSSGTVEIELVCGPKPLRRDDARPACDVETPTGFTVRHKLIIECVVTEEMHPIDKPKWTAPTGVARILRMGFEIRVTERMGLGISWDEEQPPIYEDVPESPPGYLRVQGSRLGDDIEPLGPGARPIPGRSDGYGPGEIQFEPPPSYAENRMGIADDEEWNVDRVHLSEGIRPESGDGSEYRSRSRGFSPLRGAGASSSSAAGAGPIGWQSPAMRPRLDASDFETDPMADMMRGRQLSEDRIASDQIGANDD